MAAAPYQTDERAKEAIKRRWHRKQEWGVMPLYRSTSSDRNQSYQPSILPYGTWRAKGNPRVPMVCCRTTKNRLETRMDRSYTTPSDIACQRRKESRLRTPTKEYPSREKGRQLFPWKDHLSSEKDPRSTRWRNPLQIPKAQKSVE